VGFCVTYAILANEPNQTASWFSKLDNYLFFVFGMATIFAIVGPLLFGFLMNEVQNCRSERLQLYWKTEEAIMLLSDNVSCLMDEEEPHYKVRERLQRLELLRYENLDSLEHIWDLQDAVRSIAKWAAGRGKATQKTLTRNEISLFRTAIDIEERLELLGTNTIRRICLDNIRKATHKAIWCVGILILLSIAALGVYLNYLEPVYTWALVTVSFFGVFIVFELATIAWSETKEITPQGQQEEKSTDE
jgi:hypothetical protein